ncbi:MAG: Dam family site-specific DNA-(adenine-N6)-methyltransferase [Deltaproteobacteria bacterium]|nr:Dam family site-specific DNA-(adenine-N6)-methyltransferase [Deltaproteobacteria bacterium]
MQVVAFSSYASPDRTRSAATARAPEPADAPARPFLKWVGGKGKLLDQILVHAPRGRLRYGEAFTGGGAVYFALRGEGRLASALLTDLSGDVVNAHTTVRDRPRELVAALQDHERAYLDADDAGRADYFYRVRAMRPDLLALSPVERAARMIFLNRTCFNGLWRENSRGVFNSPHGRYAQPHIANEARILTASRALQGTAIARADFRRWPELVRAHELDFVYLDPPYHPVSVTSSFNAYAGGAFAAAAQRELAEVCAELDRLGVRWMLSNSDCALVRELYARWNIHAVRAPRAVNSKGDSRGKVAEVLVTNRRSGLAW